MLTLAQLYTSAYKAYNKVCIDNVCYDVSFKDWLAQQVQVGRYWGVSVD